MKDKVKNYGQYLTPHIVSNFMCALINKPSDSAILEPSAGEGIFLKNLANNGFTNLKAYEIDKTLVNNSEINIKYLDFLSTPTKEEYDVVIGNPPYVRWKNIDESIKEKLSNNHYWKDVVNGLSDLLYPFIYKSIDLLKENGELIFITPRFWTKTQHSKELRNHILKNGELEYLILFNEMKIFKNVSSDILIFKFNKKRTGNPIKIINALSKKSLNENHLKELVEIINKLDFVDYLENKEFEAYNHEQFTSSNSWNPIPPKIRDKLKKIEESSRNNSPKIEFKNNGSKIDYYLNSLLTNEDLNNFNLSITSALTVSLLANL